MRNPYNYERQVQKGARLLDERMPGWEGKINLLTLNIKDCHQCILGQLYGEYSEGLKRIFDEGEVWSERFAHGFSHAGQRYEVLVPHWTRLILARLNRLGGAK